MIFRDGDPRHGTFFFYKQGCRCTICRDAWNHYNLMQRLRRTNEGLADDDKRHGTANGYLNYGCRCEECVSAYAAYHADNRGSGLIEMMARAAAYGKRNKRKKKK